MSLTTAEETYLKNQKKINDHKKSIDSINKTATDAMQIKRDDIEALDAQRKIDVKAKQDLIDALV